MPTYKAPLDDMRFALNDVLDVSATAGVDRDTVNQFLEETAKLAENVLAPLNAVGDREGCVYDRATKSVKTPTGFKEAYKQFCDSGMTGFSCDPAFGGLGMPQVLNTALSEMFCSANLAFGMYPGLSHGAYNALHKYGTDAQKQTYLPRLVSGEWAGTMCLTEPQCGTDLGLIKSKAVKQADGSYLITGTKIFISAGEHDLTSNIIHLVLARIEDPSTPAGIKGISLFVVPKNLPDTGARNAVYCERIEEKMGIHGNATCEIGLVAARGELVGEAHKGMKAMFVMMNEARLGVGLQGLGLSEVAYQNAVTYALDRVQSPPIDQKGESASVTIIHHPDVRRELLSIRAAVEGERMLAYWYSQLLDASEKDANAKALVDLLTPVVKAHFTDNAVDNTNSAIQVFGGHGYIKEHGMEQFNRDARITRLYEGTNGIQALDLIGRKVLQLNLMPVYLKALRADLLSSNVSFCLRWPVARAAMKLKLITICLRLRALFGKGALLRDAAGVSVDYLRLFSLVVIGHMWLKMAATAKKKIASGTEGRAFYEAKLKTARFYMHKVMPQARALEKSISTGAGSLMALDAADFAHTQTTIGLK